jgi:ketosteroid isomerase-like protein
VKPDEQSLIETALRNANPVPQPRDLIDSEPAAAVTLLIEQRRGIMTTTPTKPPQRAAPIPTRPPSRSWAWAFAGGFVAVLITIGAVALIAGGDDSSVADEPVTTTVATAAPQTTVTENAAGIDLATATAVADAYAAAWNAADGEAVAALYVEDGIAIDPGMGVVRGRAKIAADAAGRGQGVSNGARTGGLAISGENTFAYPSKFDSEGDTWAGVVELEFEGTLIATSEWLHWSLVPTELVDRYFAAWNANDPAAVAALYVQGGAHADPEIGEVAGRDEIKADVAERGPDTANLERTGDFALIEEDTFTFPAQIDRDGETWVGVVEIETRTDKWIVRTEWLRWSAAE